MMSNTLRDRVRAYATRKHLSTRDAVDALIDAGLRAHDRAVAAGRRRGETVTREEQTRASRARWKQATA